MDGGNMSLELWLHEYKVEALQAELDKQGRTVEQEMQYRLDDLYVDLVPREQRDAIFQRIENEYAVRSAVIESRKKCAAFHVTENGTEKYFTTNEGLELLDAAKKVRLYLAAEPTARPAAFDKMFLHSAEISPERFDELVGIRMENTGKVTGVFDINFDKREFSGVHIMDGWKTYALGDVSAAVYHAARKQSLSTEQQWERLLDKLDGKEITSAGHLSARNISFSDEIIADNGKLNFYMDCSFDVDTVFGTHVCTDENDDYLNVYADYDMECQQVCDELRIVLWKADAESKEITYTLNAAEKEVVSCAMDEHCLKQTGMALTDYAAQYMAEDASPMIEPTM